MSKADRERAADEARREAEEAAEERRREEEERAEERVQAAQEAADAQRASAAESFERRPVRPVDDSTETGRELDALQSLADEPEDRDPTVPAYSMTIPEDEIRTSVTIPEDEIRFTPNAPATPPEEPYARVLAASARMQQGAAPGGRSVNFDALDAQADEADASSAAAAQANLAGSPLAPPGAPMPPDQMPPGSPPPPAATPAMAAAGGPLSAPSLPPSMAAPPPPPAPLPQQQQQADARQEAVTPQGARIPQDVRTAAMPPGEPRLAEQEPRLAATSASLPAQGVDTGEPRVSDEDESRSALRQERTMKALGYILKLAGGIGGAALYNRGGSEVAATMLARGLGGVGGALTGASPTTQQARISQARRGDDQRAQQGQEMDLRRLSQAAAERRQAMLDEQGASRLDLEGRRVAALEEGLDVRRQGTESLAADRAARAEAYQESVGSLSESRRADLDRRTQETSPESEMSRTAQAQIRDLREANPRTVPLSDEQIDGLSWRDAQRWLNAGSTAAGRGRGGAGGGGGGGSSSAELGPTRSFREFAGREYPELAGLSAEERDAAISQAWSQLSGAERRAYIGGSAMSDTREDDERTARANNIPGWRWRDSSVPPDTVTIRDAQDAAEGSAAARENLAQMLDISSRVTTSDRLAGIVGESQLVADYQAARNAFIGSLPALRNTGVINEGEYQRFAREFPDVVSVRTIGNIRNNVTSAQTTIQRGYRIKMQSLGFEPDEGQGGSGGGGGATMRVRTPRGIAIRPDTPAERTRAARSDFEVLP